MTSFPISDIWYSRESRQRRVVKGLDDLKGSLSTIGLINPIIIKKDGELVAGERRLAAARDLGWTDIEVRFFDDLTELEYMQLELDENIRREDLPWQDRILSILRYHKLAQENDPKWRNEDTADALNFAVSWIYYCLRVARALEEGIPEIVEAPSYSTALGILERRTQRAQDAQTEMLDAMLGSGEEEAEPEPEDEGESTSPAPTTNKPPPKRPAIPLLHTDFITWSPTYTGPKFNLIHCDFPYGIGATSNKNKSYSKEFGEYEDDPEIYQKLLEALGTFSGIAESAHLIFWFPIKSYIYTFNTLTSLGWNVNPAPFVWVKSDGSGILPDPKRGPRQVYETAFLATRGDRFIVRAKANAVFLPPSKEYHMSEKPKDVLAHLFEQYVDGSTRLLDPTCGSGNSLIAARDQEAKAVLGLEKNETFFLEAKRNWRESTNE